MSLTPGARLGPYDILALIGAGGMGEVYRARDARLGRDVAIKVVPPLFASDPERLARFEREAKTLASLSHPHIAQIYGVETAPDGPALVMELVEGEDLAERLSRGAIPLDEALPLALQIADALEAAHERGIIHRDLKPANIKVSAGGAVKVLDFGLAKAIEGTDGSAELVNSPTMSIAGTRAGVILGTAAYMAPEQARGQAVDRRVDIWAFGVVLFEMLAGTRGFSGETISDVLASVLKNDLNWHALPRDLPAPVMTLLRRCLTPDRRNRLRDIGEARVAITEHLAHPAAPAVPIGVGAASPAAASRGWPIAAALLAIALIASLALLGRAGRMPDARVGRSVVPPPSGVSVDVVDRPSISLSPDGQALVFVGVDPGGISRLYLRGPGDFDARAMAGTDAASEPAFSPDGRTIAFAAASQLKTVSVDGAIASLTPVNDPRGVSWADAATLIYAPETIGGLFEISINGGAPRAVTKADEKAGERTHRWPHVLPGGRWVLFTVGTTASPDNYDGARIDAVDRQTGERRVVFQGASMARHAPTGHLILARGGSLFAVKFDPNTLAVSGTPVSILQAVGGDATTGAAHVAWADDGTFAYVPGDSMGGLRQLAWVDRKGTAQPLDLPGALYNDARISPDGGRAAVAVGTSGLADIWVYTFARGTFTRLTFTAVNAAPVWSADGREIFFTAIDKSGRGSTVFRTSADGGRAAVALARHDARMYLKYVSRDGAWALVDYFGFMGAKGNIGRLSLRSEAQVAPLVASRGNEYAAALSPDERLVAYQSDESGRSEVYVRELAESAGRWQISNGGGEEPMWSPDGRALYFRSDGRLMMVPVEAGNGFRAGIPSLLFSGIYNLRSDTGISYAPHPDGMRFLMVRAAATASPGTVRVVTNWFRQLRELKN